MSRFRQRWRTRPVAICIVICSPSESSKFWTHIALGVNPKYSWFSECFLLPLGSFGTLFWIFLNTEKKIFQIFYKKRKGMQKNHFFFFFKSREQFLCMWKKSKKWIFLFPLFVRVQTFTPELAKGYPLDLSILISVGKENNNDFGSNGEWSRKSSNFKSAPRRIVVSSWVRWRDVGEEIFTGK